MAWLALATSHGCARSRPRPDPHTIAVTTTGGAVEGRTTLAMPVAIPGQRTVIVPFAIESEKDAFSASDPYARGRYGAPSSTAPDRVSYMDPSVARGMSVSGSVRWHNAIFRDLGTGEEWPLVDRRAVVSWWAMFGPPVKTGEDFRPTALVFLVTPEDTDHDGQLTDLDARVAVLTDGDGRRVRVVSPRDAQARAVWQLAQAGGSDALVVQVVADTDGDGKFTHDDSPVPYIVDRAEGTSRPLVSAAMVRQVEGLLKSAPGAAAK